MTIYNILSQMAKIKSPTYIHKQQRVIQIIIIVEYVLGSKSLGQIQTELSTTQCNMVITI